MKLISKIFDVFRQKPDLVHPIYGELFFNRKGENKFWYSDDCIEINGHEVYVTFNADIEGPSENQTIFLNTFMSNIKGEIERVKPFLVECYESWGEGSLPESFEEVFSIEGITLPEDGDGNQEWSVSFGCKYDESHIYIVHYENGVPSWCAADG